ncbi:MAG: hypothetical protein Q8Q22_00755 [bacterium]|nr:hypothetical protein [bacterium]MDZ4205891.1 hypothetical protein [Patescibacteria group bacterium]
MRKSALLYTAFGLMIILGALHFTAIEFHFYWTLWWYDLMMHTLGGFIGGLIILWFLESFDSSKPILLALISVMIVGILWEIFEYVYDVAQVADYWWDTITDLIADGVGAVLACFYAMSGQTPKSSLEFPDV